MNTPRLDRKKKRLPLASAITLVAGLTLLLGLGRIRGQQESTGSHAEAATQQATLKPPPIPEAGPLGQPKSQQQVGIPVDVTRAAIPSDNPRTPEKIALGQKLFFDGRLSADGTVACSTCHDPARAFTDGRPNLHGNQRRRRPTQRTDHSERSLYPIRTIARVLRRTSDSGSVHFPASSRPVLRRSGYRYATTIRAYDRSLGAWRVTPSSDRWDRFGNSKLRFGGDLAQWVPD